MGGIEYVDLKGATYEIRFERSNAHIIFDDASPEISRVNGYDGNDLVLRSIDAASREYLRVMKNLRRGILCNPGKRKTKAEVVRKFDPDADITDHLAQEGICHSELQGVEAFLLFPSLVRQI